VSSPRYREIWIPAEEVRPGDRLIPSRTSIVAVGRTISGDVRISTASGTRITLAARTPVTVARPTA